MSSTKRINQARTEFPCGLRQADGCQRFDLAALLLGQYVAQSPLPADAGLVELGTGCGAASCQLLLLRPELQVCGLEIIPQQAECANLNAQNLGLHGFGAVCGDLRDPACLRQLRQKYGRGQQEQFDAVFCNPPWRVADDGRPSPNQAKNLALRNDATSMAAFFEAADYLLRQGGSLFVIVGAPQLDQALSSLPRRLQTARLRLVHQNPEQAAVFAMLEAVKKKKAALVVERPLFIDNLP